MFDPKDTSEGLLAAAPAKAETVAQAHAAVRARHQDAFTALARTEKQEAFEAARAARLKKLQTVIAAVGARDKSTMLTTLTGALAAKSGPRSVVSTGSLNIDAAVGTGGLVHGTIVEIYGPESSGKTTLTLHVLAEQQKAGHLCAFIDAEHAMDPVYARKIGVNTDELIFMQPDCGEQALNTAIELIEAGVTCIIIDSVAALVPKAELEGEVGDQLPGLQARMMGQALRKMTGLAAKHGALVVFINQERMKLGISMPGASNKTTPGGNALKFYASMRLVTAILGKETQVQKDKSKLAFAVKSRVRVAKNKCAPPFREAEFRVRFGTGIDRAEEVLTIGIRLGLIKKTGNTFSWNPTNSETWEVLSSRGKEATIERIRELPDLERQVVDEIKRRAAAGGDILEQSADAFLGDEGETGGDQASPTRFGGLLVGDDDDDE